MVRKKNSCRVQSHKQIAPQLIIYEAETFPKMYFEYVGDL